MSYFRPLFREVIHFDTKFLRWVGVETTQLSLKKVFSPKTFRVFGVFNHQLSEKGEPQTNLQGSKPPKNFRVQSSAGFFWGDGKKTNPEVYHGTFGVVPEPQ